MCSLINVVSMVAENAVNRSEWLNVCVCVRRTDHSEVVGNVESLGQALTGQPLFTSSGKTEESTTTITDDIICDQQYWQT